MKKNRIIILILFGFTLFLVFLGCGYSQVRQKNLERPTFKFQDTYILLRAPFEIITPSYTVYSPDYPALWDITDKKSNTLYKINKKISLGENSFVIKGQDSGISYNLVENYITNTKFKKIDYSFYEGNVKKYNIVQEYIDDIFNYLIKREESLYKIEGKANKTFNSTTSFTYQIKNEDNNVVAYIFREYRYFKDEYEIIVNKEIKSFSPAEYVSLAVFIDEIMVRHGYNYN